MSKIFTGSGFKSMKIAWKKSLVSTHRSATAVVSRYLFPGLGIKGMVVDLHLGRELSHMKRVEMLVQI